MSEHEANIPDVPEDVVHSHPSAQTDSVLPLRSGLELALESGAVDGVMYMLVEPIAICYRAGRKLATNIDRII